MPSEQQARTPESVSGSDGAIMPGIAGRTVNQMEDTALRGATAVSQLAHRAADQFDKTADYLQKAGQRTLTAARDKSRELQDAVGRNPVPMILAATAVGIGIGYLVTRRRA